jgi:hypothetical protein
MSRRIEGGRGGAPTDKVLAVMLDPPDGLALNLFMSLSAHPKS